MSDTSDKIKSVVGAVVTVVGIATSQPTDAQLYSKLQDLEKKQAKIEREIAVVTNNRPKISGTK